MDYKKVVKEIFSQIKGVRFDVKVWDGESFRYGEKTEKPRFTLVFKQERAAKQLLSQGALGFGEAYMQGSLRIEGSIDEYLKIRHQFKNIKPSFRLFLASVLSKRNDPSSTEEQIAYHYDMGNDFFTTFLDKLTLSYSCAMFKMPEQDISSAQEEKLRYICNLLNLPKGSTVLDLGSGWGGFANYAAKNYGWKIKGYTLSKKQLKYCNELVDMNKLKNNITIRFKDMLTQLPNKQYDAVVLIESIEHVGKDRLQTYFDDLFKLVKPGGSLYIQSTGQYKSKTVDRFITKYVFPGGYLPSYRELTQLPVAAGFRISELRDDTADYIKTISTWIQNIEANKDYIEEHFGESFYRLWELWTHGARVSFGVGYMSLFRLHLKKPSNKL